MKNPPAMQVPCLGQEDSPGGEQGNPLQYSCLENAMDRGVWRATVHRVTQSWTRLKQLSMHTCRVSKIQKLLKLTAAIPTHRSIRKKGTKCYNRNNRNFKFGK